MISKMRKYSYFVFEPEYYSFLKQLRDLGVVHVQQRNDPKQIEHIRNIDEQLKELAELRKKLYRIVSLAPEKGENVEPADVTTYDELKENLQIVEGKIAEIQKKLDETRDQMRDFQTWGDFDPNLIDRLQQNGFYLHFWTVLTNQYNPEWESLFNAQIVEQSGRSTYFVTVTKDPNGPGLEYAERIVLPHTSLSALEVDHNTLTVELVKLNQQLVGLAKRTDILDQHETELKNQFKFDSAYYQGEKLYDNKLVIMEGWVPDELAPAMQQSLDQMGYAYSEMQISEGENVPIKLKNNRFSRAFEPIVELFSLPNYWELDPTPFLAPFFMLFFGMCFGDAGYGIVLLAMATIFKRKAKPGMKIVLELIQWLGVSGIVVGFFSGSFFGVELVKVPFLQSIRGFFISSNNMMVIALAVGFIQIIVGKFVAALKVKKQSGLKASLASFAWPTLIIIFAMMVGLPMMKITLPKVVEYILFGIAGLSVLIAFFYNTPGKNIFLNFGSALWKTYNTASGLLGDTLSYIRLFAIGLTGAILGQVFNTLAMTATSGLSWYLAIPVGLIVFLLGHSINFGLTMIGALVHPVRLIFVEYFNNSEYEGGGTKYEPLKVIPSKNN